MCKVDAVPTDRGGVDQVIGRKSGKFAAPFGRQNRVDQHEVFAIPHPVDDGRPGPVQRDDLHFIRQPTLQAVGDQPAGAVFAKRRTQSDHPDHRRRQFSLRKWVAHEIQGS